MKTITIEGKEYEVPDEAQWVAMDQDGSWSWYSEEPVDGGGHCGFWSIPSPQFDVKYDVITPSNEAWRETKRRI